MSRFSSITTLNIINVESFIRQKNSIISPTVLQVPHVDHKIGRIYQVPDYKYEIIILDNSSSSPTGGWSTQPAKRDYLTKSSQNEFLFLLSSHHSLPSTILDS